MTGATCFGDSVVRFADWGVILCRIPSAKALGYSQSSALRTCRVPVKRAIENSPAFYLCGQIRKLENAREPQRAALPNAESLCYLLPL